MQPRILYPARLSFKIEREKKKKEEEELGLRKPQSESSHSNKPAYRFNHEHVSNKIK